MTTSRTAIPTGRPFPVANLAAMPDDGNRYELVDAMLPVSPAPFPVTVVPARLLDRLRP